MSLNKGNFLILVNSEFYSEFDKRGNARRAKLQFRNYMFCVECRVWSVLYVYFLYIVEVEHDDHGCYGELIVMFLLRCCLFYVINLKNKKLILVDTFCFRNMS
jgi:hypothetical protein